MVRTQTQRIVEGEICMAEIKKDISFIKTEITELKNTMRDFIESSPSKFAIKEVEIRVLELEKANVKQQLFAAKVAGGAITIFFIIQIALKHFNLL